MEEMKMNEVNDEVDVNCKQIRVAQIFEILAAVLGEILTLLCVSLIYYGLAAMDIICRNISSFSEISNSQIFYSSSYIVIMLSIIGNSILFVINKFNKRNLGKTISKLVTDLGYMFVVLILNTTSALAFLLNRKDAAFSALMLILFLIVVKTLATSTASRLSNITQARGEGINSVPEPALNARQEK